MKNSNIRLSYVPRAWQAECHRKKRRFSVLAVHRRAGKTILALMELLDKAMQYPGELGQFVYLAPLLKQAENISWRKLKQIIEPMRLSGAVEVREGDLEVIFKHNNAKIRLFGANNPDEIRGMGLDGVVVDEVAQIEPVVWEEIVRPTLSDRRGWALFIGTPYGINLFSELYFKAQQTEDWMAMRYTVYETNAIDPEEIVLLEQEMTPNAFAREYLCDFMAAGEEQVISLTDVENAAHRTYKKQDYYEAPRVLGVDPARFGNDRAVIFRRQGLVAFEPIVVHGQDTIRLASLVAQEIDDWKPDAVFIDSGAGAGVIDRLRQLDHTVVEIPFGGKAIKETQFSDRRAEMWFAMADWLRAGGSIPNRPTLKQELATPTYWYDGDRKRLESKDQIKKRLQGRSSPDEADALALTFADKVQQRSRVEEMESRLAEMAALDPKAGRTTYDPFGKDAQARRRRQRRA